MIDSSLEHALLKNGYIITPIKGTSMTPLLKEGSDLKISIDKGKFR